MRTKKYTVTQSVDNQLLKTVPQVHEEVKKRMAQELCDYLVSLLDSGEPYTVKMLEQREGQAIQVNMTEFSRRLLFAEFIHCKDCESTSGGAIDPICGRIWCRTWGEFVDPYEFCARAERRLLQIGRIKP